MADFRKEALIKTLKEDYGITTAEQLTKAISGMKKLDITQFVFRDTERNNNGTKKQILSAFAERP